MQEHTKSPAFIARACLVGLLIALPSLIAYVFHSPVSPLLFKDWDEAFYLAVNQRACGYSFGEYVSVLVQSGYPVPHKLLDFVLCRGFRVLGLGPGETLLLLDFFCGAAAYVSAALFFRLFAAPRVAEWAAFATVLWPWLAAFSTYIPLPSGVSWIVTIPHRLFPSLPAQRALYTQLSVPLFFIALFLQVRASREEQLRGVLLAGLVSASLLYVYFFGWVVAGFVGFAFLLHPFLLSRCSRLQVLKRLALFTLSFLCLSLPGVYMLFGSGELFRPGVVMQGTEAMPAIEYRGYWYFSWVTLVLLIAALRPTYRSFRNSGGDRGNAVWYLVAVLLASELILPNFQPLLNRWLTPYHFTLFYLHPLLSGCCMMLLLSASRSRMFRSVSCLVLLVSTLVVHVSSISSTFQGGEEFDSIVELVQAVRGYTSSSATVAVSAFSESPPGRVFYSLDPYWVAALSGRSNFSDFVGYSPHREEAVRRELYLGLLLFGEVKMIGPCDITPPQYPGDIFSGASFYLTQARIDDCALGNRLRGVITPCDLSRQQNVDALVLSANESIQSELARAASAEVWRSSNFRLIHFHSKDFSSSVCAAESRSLHR